MANWFEGDDGMWWNLDQAKTVTGPTGRDQAEIDFTDGSNGLSLTAAEWERVRLQLRNSQQTVYPFERLPDCKAAALDSAGNPQPLGEPNKKES